jgi:hypothetical protein
VLETPFSGQADKWTVILPGPFSIALLITDVSHFHNTGIGSSWSSLLMICFLLPTFWKNDLETFSRIGPAHSVIKNQIASYISLHALLCIRTGSSSLTTF